MDHESRRKRRATRLSPTIKLKIMDMKILALENPDDYGSTGSAEWMSELLEYIEDEAVEIQDIQRWASTYPWILDQTVTEVPKSPKKSPRAQSRRRRRRSSAPSRKKNKRAARASAIDASVPIPNIDEAYDVVTNYMSVKMEPVEDDDSDVEEVDVDLMNQSAYVADNVQPEYNASASTESVDQVDVVEDDDIFEEYSDVPLDLSRNVPHFHESNDEAEQEYDIMEESETCVHRLVIQIGGKEYEGFIPVNQIDDPSACMKIGFQEVVKGRADLQSQDENETEAEPGTSASGRTNAESADKGNLNETPAADIETSFAVPNRPNEVPDSNAESTANIQQASTSAQNYGPVTLSGIAAFDNGSPQSASSSSLSGVSMLCNAGSSNSPVFDSSNSDSAGSSNSGIPVPGVSDYDVSQFLKNNPIQWSNNFLTGHGQYPEVVQSHPPSPPQIIELSPPQKQSDTENKKSVAVIPYEDMRMSNQVYPPPWTFEEGLITQNVIGHLSTLKICLESLPDSAVLVQPFNLFVQSFSAYQGKRAGIPYQTRF